MGLKSTAAVLGVSAFVGAVCFMAGRASNAPSAKRWDDLEHTITMMRLEMIAQGDEVTEIRESITKYLEPIGNGIFWLIEDPERAFKMIDQYCPGSKKEKSDE